VVLSSVVPTSFVSVESFVKTRFSFFLMAFTSVSRKQNQGGEVTSHNFI